MGDVTYFRKRLRIIVAGGGKVDLLRGKRGQPLQLVTSWAML